MAGVEERVGDHRGRDEVDAPGDDEIDDWGPPPWRSPWQRVGDRIVGVVRPWIAWFGVGRVTSGAITIVVAVGVGWWLLRPAQPPTEAALPYASTTVASGDSAGPTSSVPGAATTITTVPGVVVVHVAGAVVAPGVVELTSGARVADAVELVGGAQPDADLGAINLAAPLQDGQQVYVPRVGEHPAPNPAAAASAASAGAPATTTAVGPVDLNRASVAELDGLPGIGPTTAAAIVAHRDANGPFASVDDLESVRGIGPAKLDALRGLVTTGPPAGPPTGGQKSWPPMPKRATSIGTTAPTQTPPASQA